MPTFVELLINPPRALKFSARAILYIVVIAAFCTQLGTYYLVISHPTGELLNPIHKEWIYLGMILYSLLSILVTSWQRKFIMVVAFSTITILQIPAFFATVYETLGLYYTQCPAVDNACHAVNHDSASSLYFSLVTFSTVGYGDFIPANNTCRFVAAFEALSGYIVMGILIAILTTALLKNKS